MKSSIGLILAASLLISSNYETHNTKRRHEKKERECLNCGKHHLHNNSFCSAECCKGYGK